MKLAPNQTKIYQEKREGNRIGPTCINCFEHETKIKCHLCRICETVIESNCEILDKLQFKADISALKITEYVCHTYNQANSFNHEKSHLQNISFQNIFSDGQLLYVDGLELFGHQAQAEPAATALSLQ